MDIETGYEILSRRIYRTEYNNEILWTRGGGLKGGSHLILKVSIFLYFFKDEPYSAVTGSPLSFINDDSSLYILIQTQNYRNQRQKWILLIMLRVLEALGIDL